MPLCMDYCIRAAWKESISETMESFSLFLILALLFVFMRLGDSIEPQVQDASLSRGACAAAK